MIQKQEIFFFFRFGGSLIDLNDDVHPILVLSDFGCSLADKANGLELPYTSYDVDRGGNSALMAPGN